MDGLDQSIPDRRFWTCSDLSWPGTCDKLNCEHSAQARAPFSNAGHADILKSCNNYFAQVLSAPPTREKSVTSVKLWHGWANEFILLVFSVGNF